MPGTASGLAYAAGFVSATALLHAIGIGLGLAAGKTGAAYSRRIVQAGGGAMTLAGIAILAGAV
jgi:urease accessory protein